MRKTKIVCTLGPATDREGVLRQMLQAGMNVARFNFSHGSYDEHQRRLDQLVALREELHLPVAAMLDTKGPEVRLRSFQNGPVQLKIGQSFTLTTDDVPGDESRCSITYAQLPQDVKPGDTILLDDGLVRLTVLETTEREIRCRVENDGVMKDKKGVNVPGVSLSMPYMNQRDREDILFGIRQGFDFIAASFVRSAADIREIRHILDRNHSRIRIIAKIENQEGVSNLADILSVADGIMVARGDMGVEIDFTEIPAIQKSIIAQCVAAGKPVITATQMLDSMIENPRPTRAEITDVANAIYDGTSAIMLSGETAAGKYPVEAVQTMDAIARKTESNIDRICPAKTPKRTRLSITAATAHAACTTAEDIGADAILTVSQRGITAQMVSRFRPAATVVALLLDPQVQRQMALYWGLVPITMPRASSTDQAGRPGHSVRPGGGAGEARGPGGGHRRRAGGNFRHHQYDPHRSGGRLPGQRHRRGQPDRLRSPVRLPDAGGYSGEVPPRRRAGGALYQQRGAALAAAGCGHCQRGGQRRLSHGHRGTAAE